MNRPEKKRLDYLDRMRGLAILLVIVGHIIQFNHLQGGKENKVFEIIYSFHMPLFFILSGYVSGLSKNRITSFKSYFKFVLKKIRTLLLPLFTWSLIAGKYFFSENIEIIGLNNFLDTLLHPGLWFLQVLFEIHLVFGIYCLVNSKFNKPDGIKKNIFFYAIFFIPIIFGYLLIDHSHFQTVTLFTIFFIMGNFISKNKFVHDFLSKRIIYTISLFLFLILSGLWSINGNMYHDLLKILISSFAFVAILFLAKQLTLPKKIDNYFQLIGKESLAIYIMQFYLTSELFSFQSDTLSINQFIMFFGLILISIPIAFICIGFHRIIEHSRLLNLILFGVRY